MLEAPIEAIHNQTFNVGQTDENYRVSELAEIVAETVPGCRIEYAPGGGPDKRCYRVSCEKIARLVPSFRPQWTARKGAVELLQAYRAAVQATGRFDCNLYVRLSQLKELIETGRLDASLRWNSANAVRSVA